MVENDSLEPCDNVAHILKHCYVIEFCEHLHDSWVGLFVNDKCVASPVNAATKHART